MTVSPQIPLNIYLNDEATFDNFFVGVGSLNAFAVEAIKDFSGKRSTETFIYLWGGSSTSSTGLSHLLQAACHDMQKNGGQAQYLPLRAVAHMEATDLLEGFEHQDLLCLDGMEAVLGRPDWDEALFHLYNRIQYQHNRLLVSAHCAPRDIKSSLPDLLSRLSWGSTYRLEALNDLEKQQALQQRAARRGMELTDDAAIFMLNHGPRETKQLFECLDLLDRRSLAEKRKLTLPFIKEVLGL